MTQHEMLEYLADGFRPAVTAELSCKRCGDFRLFVQEDYSGESVCPVCDTPSPIDPFTGVCLTNRELPVFAQVRVPKTFLYASK